MKNNLENEEILSKEILNAIDLIIEQMPHAVFGGSIALNAVGLLNRQVKDIDLFISEKESFSASGFLNIEQKNDSFSETVTDTNGRLIKRTGGLVAGVKTCCFQVSDEELQHSEIEILGRKIRIQNVNFAIMAKMSYADRSGKHKADLEQINKTFSNFFD